MDVKRRPAREPSVERIRRATARSWRPASSDTGAPHSGRAARGGSGDGRARIGFVFSGQGKLCEANHESFRVRDFEVPFSPFGIPKRGGRKTLLNKIPAEAVYSTNAENHPNRTIPRTAGYVAKIDNTLAGAHRCKGRIGPAIRDVEPKLLIEGHRFAHITYRQRHCADVVDRPR